MQSTKGLIASRYLAIIIYVVEGFLHSFCLYYIITFRNSLHLNQPHRSTCLAYRSFYSRCIGSMHNNSIDGQRKRKKRGARTVGKAQIGSKSSKEVRGTAVNRGQRRVIPPNPLSAGRWRFFFSASPTPNYTIPLMIGKVRFNRFVTRESNLPETKMGQHFSSRAPNYRLSFSPVFSAPA